MVGSKGQGKSFGIPKSLIVAAWEKVRANRGAPGVDGVSVNQFEAALADNLYKLWNRMSSGSYIPGAVRAVEIPKDHGAGVRVLGVPNVADRVAQTAAAMVLERSVEPVFHPDSYGYRPYRGALDALAVTRARCWEFNWVVDMDIRAFFDSVPHDLMIKAVAAHTQERWLLLYVQRWLTAPIQMSDGRLVAREKGTPQGSPISPVLANLFMHYAFDMWMVLEHPEAPFARYADDAVIHCRTKAAAQAMVAQVAERLAGVGLELHPTKTKIVYCRDGKRKRKAQQISFDFLGYTFRARAMMGSNGLFTGFAPAISDKALKAVTGTARNWHLNRRSGDDLSALAADINPQVAGWINYYGAFYRSRLHILGRRIDKHLINWAMRKYKRLRGHPERAWTWLHEVQRRDPKLFAHWTISRPRPST